MLPHPRGAAALSGEGSLSKFYFNSPLTTAQRSPRSHGQAGVPARHPSFLILSRMWVPVGEGKLFLAFSLSAKT